MTITEAIRQVMEFHNSPMTAEEAYRAIIDAKLYEFHADNPGHVVRSQIRRHCIGLDFPSAAPTKHFRLVGESRYEPVNKIIRQPRKHRITTPINMQVLVREPHASSLLELQSLHAKYVSELKRKILGDLRRMSPTGFELFAKRLLDVYGFHDTKVTKVSGDGGIDGYGKLKVGLANLNVAFQCKRWAKGNIQRPEIDKFRGAAQGDFEQGLFFTTASFSEGAVAASIKRGAVPIVLVDGRSIVDLMIEKGFGVQVETLLIPSYALDLALGTESHG
ncbi:restriction endonuclease [Pseudomonas sp. SXM-1]|uniref:restriction endonuclease n=1 Tax=Pseudomonas sp. SXM-1 TaxID=2169583 RepID=UPI0010684DF1|nr:restriction endonuclease [Pseudomonas sp. SXM-1]QBQ10270.1 restriction endonuclease [Pseudomonas sp. SXM-1]